MVKNRVAKDEIDLIELVKVVWSKRKFIFKVSGIFFLAGILLAVTSKVEYEASCKLLPENQETNLPDLGGLGGLAGLAGFDLSGIGSETMLLTPELYPEIVKSTPFLVSLINTPVYFEKLDSLTSSLLYFKEIDKPSLFGYILEYTVGIPGKIRSLRSHDTNLNSLEEQEIKRYSKEDWKLIEEYASRLSVSVDSKTGIISVSTELPDPVAAAQLAKLLVEKLTEEITSYKSEKARVNLEFIENQFLEAETDYEKKQEQLARFADRNRNITTSLIQAEYERLQNELNIAFEVYKGLATQLEQAKIKVKEETPVFTILEPVRVPIEKSKPKRSLIVLLMVFVGGFSSIVWVLFQNSLVKK